MRGPTLFSTLTGSEQLLPQRADQPGQPKDLLLVSLLLTQLSICG